MNHPSVVAATRAARDAFARATTGLKLPKDFSIPKVPFSMADLSKLNLRAPAGWEERFARVGLHPEHLKEAPHWSPLALGAAGAIPFLALSAPVANLVGLPDRVEAHRAQIQASYAVAIVSFLGGCHWGFAASAGGIAKAAAAPVSSAAVTAATAEISRVAAALGVSAAEASVLLAGPARFAWATTPALMAWISASAFTLPWQMVTLGGSLLAALVADVTAARHGLMPRWMMPMRHALTAAAVASLLTNVPYAIEASYDEVSSEPTLVPIRSRSRGERRTLRTLPGVSLRPRTPRFQSPPATSFNSASDAFQLHPDVRPRQDSRESELRRYRKETPKQAQELKKREKSLSESAAAVATLRSEKDASAVALRRQRDAAREAEARLAATREEAATAKKALAAADDAKDAAARELAAVKEELERAVKAGVEARKELKRVEEKAASGSSS